MEWLSIQHMILGILLGCLFDPTLKIKMMRVLCRSFVPMRTQFVFKFVGMPCLHSLPWKSLISLSNDVHLKKKTLEKAIHHYGKVPSVKCLQCFFFNLNLVWEFYWLLAFVNFITLITLRWYGQFISSSQLFLAIKLIAFLYISNSMCTGVQLWNPQTGFKLK